MLHSIINLVRPLILFDLETTEHEGKKYAVDFGMKIYRPNSPIVDEYHTLINPGVPMNPEAAAVHHITDDVIATGCAKCGVLIHEHDHTFHAWVPIPKWADLSESIDRGFANVDFAGYSVEYDLNVVEEEQNRQGKAFDFSKAYLLDAYHIWRLLEKRTLSDAVEYFGGQPHVNAHTAMGDVIGTEIALFGQFHHPKSHILPRTMAEIHALCFANRVDWIDRAGKFKFIDGVPCFNFGPQNGKPLAQHPRLLAWVIRKNFPTDTKRIAAECLQGRYPVQQLAQETDDGRHSEADHQ